MSKDNAYVQGLISRRADFQKERERIMQMLKEGQERLQTLNGAVMGIDQLLLLEGVKPHPPATSIEVSGEQTLADALKLLLSDKKPRTVEELIELAKENGINFDNKNPIRAVGFTLMGIGRGGKYIKLDDGRWKFTG